jgi:hypothetical protein
MVVTSSGNSDEQDDSCKDLSKICAIDVSWPQNLRGLRKFLKKRRGYLDCGKTDRQIYLKDLLPPGQICNHHSREDSLWPGN